MPEQRSNTSVCLSVVDPAFTALDAEAQAAFTKAMVSRLDKAGAAYDIGAYKDAPPGLRIWAGSTIEAESLAGAAAVARFCVRVREGRAAKARIASRE